MNPTTIQLIATILFVLALLHTFSTHFFEYLAHTHPAHAGVWHLLSEVEVVFGFWASILMLCMFVLEGTAHSIHYMDALNFTEPMFVFVIMVVAGTRPILRCALLSTQWIARWMGGHGSLAFYLVTLILIPVLGSLITEPAAMTLAALIVRDHFFVQKKPSEKFMYATLGVLFVNISIGGALTNFAAPPILMVAGKWGWNADFMLATFGWKAMIAIVLNALIATTLFRKELRTLTLSKMTDVHRVPLMITAIHVLFLAGIVLSAHSPALFMGLFLLFLGVSQAYQQYQDRLILREGLLVALFLAGLVVLGGQQKWWLQPVLLSMKEDSVFWGSIVLTAFTDNAALTYLGSLVDGLSDSFKYALTAGAITGGGLTIIANAPNPAGISIVRNRFKDQMVSPFALFLGALLPTCVAALAFRLI